MMFSPWVKAALGAAYGLLLIADGVSGSRGNRFGGSPGYRNFDRCPKRCADAGTDPTKWTYYHSQDQFKSCPLTVFQAFSIYDDVDDSFKHHGIYACSSYGPDFKNLPTVNSLALSTAESINATFELGWYDDGYRTAASEIRSAVKQLRQYLEGGYGSTKAPQVLYVRSGRASVGVYIGQGLQNEAFSATALKSLEDNLRSFNASSQAVAMQFCQPDYTSEHIFGLFATSNSSFAPIQQALQTWSNSTCLSFPNSQSFSGPVVLNTAIVPTSKSNTTANSTSSTAVKRRSSRVKLQARAECTTEQVIEKDSCGAIATRCGISPSDFTKYNDDAALCSTLKPGQHVCCSAGDLPDFRPKPNEDGSCHMYYVPMDDNCSKISGTYSLTNEDLEEFNKETWGWSGCGSLPYNINICLSKGDPPMPATLEGTVCGPAVPGTERPTDGTKLAELNPCPLNACCDVWGQCGITAEFCTDTSTGNPGTAKPNTNGCISNCGTSMVRGDAPATFRRVAYYEGYGMGRECLLQDALQIDRSEYTHIHFAFGILTPDYQVGVGDALSAYQFENFKRLEGPARILSFGGWDFSTMPDTYKIFREGVTSANRFKMASAIADFIKLHNLDGVDIDWEYPSAPDLPDFDPGKKEDGANYLAFLVVLKNLLPGKSVAIAAPASYWYLKGFPIKEISKVVDYIIYMTYDLHGQWDANNENAVEGCANGNCLRSQVNLTETMSSMVMITKAGVPSNKVVVGVTSYGRSFNMAEAGCYGPACLYTGTRLQSDATKGRCTGTAGYISNAEIKEIIDEGSRVTNHFVDAKSNSNILVYDDLQWVGYMDDDIRASRNTLYAGLNMGGTTNWASDLDSFHDVPKPMTSWAQFKQVVIGGGDPWNEGPRSGNWTDIGCHSQAAEDDEGLSPKERWDGMDCDSAWNDAIDRWNNNHKGDKSGFSFSESVSKTLNGPAGGHCETLTDMSNCNQNLLCPGFDDGEYGGAAGWAIWGSFVYIHEMYSSYHNALFKAAASVITPSFSDFENKFQPIPPEEDNTWLLLLLDLVTVGVSGIAAPFFNNFLSKLPYIIKNANAAANLHEITSMAIGQSTTIAKDLLSTSADDWDEDAQDSFSNYLGQAIGAWGNIASQALERLFDGSEESINTLYKIISEGHLLSGDRNSVSTKPPTDSEEKLEANIAKAFFGYAIPTAWIFSKHYTFVIDSGYPCDTKDPLGDYLDADTMHKTYGCYEDKLYYIASPKGKSSVCNPDCSDSFFTAPPGIESLDGKSFGGIKVQDLIQG